MRTFLISALMLMCAGGFSSCTHNPTTPPAPPVLNQLTIVGPQVGTVDSSLHFTAHRNFSTPAKFTWVFEDSTVTQTDSNLVWKFRDTGRHIFRLSVLRLSDSTLLCSTSDTVLIAGDTHSSVQIDTTSHNFTWTEFTNVQGQSNMTGCWVFGPNDIIAVNDRVYRYDGTNWNWWKLVTESGGYDAGFSGYSIFGFTPSDFWLIHGGLIGHCDGNVVHGTDLSTTGVWHYPSDGAIHSAWGTSSKDMYFVGDSGTILHYDGTNWMKFPKVTGKMLGSIWGTSDNDIWAAGYNSTTAESEVLHFDGTSWSEDVLATSGQAYAYGIGGVFTCDSSKHMFVAMAGSTIFRRTDNGAWQQDGTVPNGDHIGMGIYGNSANDLLAIGGWGLIAHWSGNTWLRYNQYFEPGNSDYGALAASVKGNTACIVGVKNGTSWALVGQRK